MTKERMNVINVPISSLKESTKAWRWRKRDVTDLAESIREHGMLQPIIARMRNNKLHVIAERSRLRAAEQAGLEQIPTSIVEVDGIEAEMRSIEENVQRYELRGHERRAAIARYHELWVQKHGAPKRGRPPKNGAPRPNFERDAARKFRVDRSTLKRAVANQKKLHPKVMKAWRSGKITTSQADKMGELPRKKQLQLLPKAIAQTPDETKAMVTAIKHGKDKGYLVERLRTRLRNAAVHAVRMKLELSAAQKLAGEMSASEVAEVFLSRDLLAALDALVWLRDRLGDGAKAAA